MRPVKACVCTRVEMGWVRGWVRGWGGVGGIIISFSSVSYLSLSLSHSLSLLFWAFIHVCPYRSRSPLSRSSLPLSLSPPFYLSLPPSLCLSISL